MRSPPTRCPSVGIAREGPRPDPCLWDTLMQGLAHRGPREPRKVLWVQQRSAGGDRAARLESENPSPGLAWRDGSRDGQGMGWPGLAPGAPSRAR